MHHRVEKNLGKWLLLGILLLVGCRREPTHTQNRNALTRPFRFVMGGGVVATGAADNTRFTDVAATAGLHYQWKIEGRRPLTILQTIGNGCAFLDYNQDSNLDLLLVGPKIALYQGDGQGHFTDVSSQTGLASLSGHFLGGAVGDYDNDGFPDLYLTGYREGRLLHNDRGVFRNVTQEAGLKPQPWGTSALFTDLNNDGKLDLYIGNYVDFGPETQPRLCVERGVETACEPQTYRELRGACYRNDGNGHFTDWTETSGLNTTSGKTLGVVAADYDGSGRPSLALANDTQPGDLMRFQDGKFVNMGLAAGVALDRDGNTHAGMGIDWGDYDNDGNFDLLVTTFAKEPRSLYQNDGKGIFTDRGIQTGLATMAAQYVAFGVKFFDYDNDGWLDFAVANGHVSDNIAEINPLMAYRQPTEVYRNIGGKNPAFENVSNTSPDLMRPIVGRGLATGDYDNDGRVDLLVVDSEGKPLLLHNETRGKSTSFPGNWLGVRLVGTKSNRDGYGAIVTAFIGGRKLTRLCQSGGSYFSASDARVHFGLGTAPKVEKLTVRWPSGKTQTFPNPPLNRYTILQETP